MEAWIVLHTCMSCTPLVPRPVGIRTDRIRAAKLVEWLNKRYEGKHSYGTVWGMIR